MLASGEKPFQMGSTWLFWQGELISSGRNSTNVKFHTSYRIHICHEAQCKAIRFGDSMYRDINSRPGWHGVVVSSPAAPTSPPLSSSASRSSAPPTLPVPPGSSARFSAPPAVPAAEDAPVVPPLLQRSASADPWHCHCFRRATLNFAAFYCR